ncbi:MAG: hypothetical protein OES79_04260 [Planctomycetota bacterium]|nr:hypothetical protein [Planctomycetota bacterium]
MRNPRALTKTLAAAVMMAAVGSAAYAEHATSDDIYAPTVVNRTDLSRWFVAQKNALIDVRNARRRQIKDDYICALRGSYGYQRKYIADKFRYDLAAVNNTFRGDMDALNAAFRSQVAGRYQDLRSANRPVAYAAPLTVDAPYAAAACSTGKCDFRPGLPCTRCQRGKRSREILRPACGTGACDLPPASVPVPALDAVPVPEVSPIEPIPGPPAIPPGEYGVQPTAYGDGWLARVIALRDLLSELF